MRNVSRALEEFQQTGVWIRPALFVLFGVLATTCGFVWDEGVLLVMGATNFAIAAGTVATERFDVSWAWHHFDALYILGSVAVLGTGVESAALLVAGNVYSGTLLFSRPVFVRQIGLIAIGVVVVLLGGDSLVVADLTTRQQSVVDSLFLSGGLAIAIGLAPAIRVIVENMLDAQRKAEQAERSRADSLVATARTVAHEVRNPLASITGFSGILIDGWEELPDSDRRSFVETIASEADRLNRLVGDLLDGMRLEAGALNMDLEIVGVSEIVGDVMLAYGSADKTVRVGELPAVSVVADPLRMSQVLRNLVGNAMKYGGDTIELSVVAIGECVTFEISDNGPGVPPDKVASIFGDFVQADNAGSSTGFGLGLGIARQLAERMDGSLEYRDRPGGGAVFTVSVPLWRDMLDRPVQISPG